MKLILRNFINLNEGKIREKYKIPKTDGCDIINCIKEKWNLFRDDWEQGFDSDCFGHCTEYKKCSKIFYDDKECHNENHMKQVYIPFVNKPCKFEESIDV